MIKPKPLLWSPADHQGKRRTKLIYLICILLYSHGAGTSRSRDKSTLPGKEEEKRRRENLFLTIHSSRLIKLSAEQIQRFTSCTLSQDRRTKVRNERSKEQPGTSAYPVAPGIIFFLPAQSFECC